MNEFLQMLQGLLKAQNPQGGSLFGIPQSFNPAIGNLFSSIQNMDGGKQYNLNTDPQKDIEPYRVNAYKGFSSFKSGGSVNVGENIVFEVNGVIKRGKVISVNGENVEIDET